MKQSPKQGHDGANIDNGESVVVDRFVFDRSDEREVPKSGDLRRRRDPDHGGCVQREEQESADRLVRDGEEVQASNDGQKYGEAVKKKKTVR